MNFSNLYGVYIDAYNALKAVSRNRIASNTRVAIWNAFFPETPISLSTSLRHLLAQIFYQYSSGGATDRFCFELSVLFVDLPIQFYELTIICQAPLSIALRNAYKVVNGHLQMPNQESMAKLIQSIVQTLPKEKLPIFKGILQAIFWDKSNTDAFIDQMKEIIEPTCFDAFLEAMPPTSRLRYALRYDRPAPKVIIDYHRLEMPIEFIQAIAEIDGKPEARKLFVPKKIEDLYKLYINRNELASNPFSDSDSDSDLISFYDKPNESLNSIEENLSTNSIEENLSTNPFEGNLSANPFEGNLLVNPIEEHLSTNQFENVISTNPIEENLSTNPFEGNLLANPIEENLSTNQIENDLSTNQIEKDPSTNPIEENLSTNTIEESLSTYPFKEDLSANPFEESISTNPNEEKISTNSIIESLSTTLTNDNTNS